ncbi:MAG: helix-turn-helix transcriptional regulator [Gaiellaceae bacterium MAG52_C11]|nr:helix-turn-helix transcriptional regulator [Candidatus Gaiellasilicea maunaloa]
MSSKSEDGRAVAAAAQLTDRWTLLIVHDLSEGARRFIELERACAVCPATLSRRLRTLEREGLVRRRRFAETPPRVEYELTRRGCALLPVLAAMRRFGETWLTLRPAESQRT